VRAPACAAALVTAALLWAADARAAETSRVVLLRAPSADTLTEQGNTLLAAELRAAGFEVVTVARDPSRDIRRDIEAASAASSPIATFAILPAPDGAAVELWLEDRITHKLTIRRLDVDRSREAPADLAVRAVELLRGSLLEVALPPPAPRPQPAAPPEDVTVWIASTVPERRAPHFSTGPGVALGMTALGSAGLGPTYAPALRLSWGNRRGLFARATVTGFGWGRTLRASEGSAVVRQDLALAEIGFAFRPEARLQPFVAAGAGARRARSEGTGVSTLFPGESGTAYAAAAVLGGGIAARLADRVSAILDAGLIVAAPSTEILIATSPVGRVGAVGILATLTLATTF
jgi:hypothetical protein